MTTVPCCFCNEPPKNAAEIWTCENYVDGCKVVICVSCFCKEYDHDAGYILCPACREKEAPGEEITK